MRNEVIRPGRLQEIFLVFGVRDLRQQLEGVGLLTDHREPGTDLSSLASRGIPIASEAAEEASVGL